MNWPPVPEVYMRQSDPHYDYYTGYIRVDYDCDDLLSALNNA